MQLTTSVQHMRNSLWTAIFSRPHTHSKAHHEASIGNFKTAQLAYKLTSLRPVVSPDPRPLECSKARRSWLLLAMHYEELLLLKDEALSMDASTLKVGKWRG